jgi:hypothetical protein
MLNNNNLRAALLGGNPRTSVNASSSGLQAEAFDIKKNAIKFSVSTAYTLPFILSTIEIANEYPIMGPVFGSLACACIFRIGWVLYAEHFIGLFDSQDELAHLSGHFEIADGQAIEQWNVSTKLAVSVLAVAFTFPLGLTKIGYTSTDDSAVNALKICYLILYSIIDASPHVNHLQLQSQAWEKYKTLSLLSKCWVPMLMLGHSLSDSADLWNASGLWMVWVCLAIPAEVYLSNVEAVAHHQPHFPRLTGAGVLKFSALLLGAVSIAIFNWYNTFEAPSSFELAKPSPLLFCMLQLVNILFVTFEAWNHDTESHVQDALDAGGRESTAGGGGYLYSPVVAGDVLPTYLIANNFGQTFIGGGVGGSVNDVLTVSSSAVSNSTSITTTSASSAAPGSGWANNSHRSCRAGCKH